ncbi:hypothetical protein [Rhizobium sp. C1]|uniref:hypothetical protein n=1 Tax=Rhizobium sp. C1 TaxID=1349799 RepID=UPI001E61D31D|nr:hypothetical protein [Rhizobium sp. C1]MCD2180312.1 hypothetical protein [Rhizobium sp. C1]
MIDGCDDTQFPWPGVTFPLQMAASIEDVFADPSYIDESDAGLYCGTAWDRDEEDRDAASEYVAALTIFNFVWMAYEDAIRQSNILAFSREKLPVQARKHFAEHASQIDQIPALTYLYRIARKCCLHADPIADEVRAIETKYKLTGASAAAELGRVFRNYVVHGSDPIPLDGFPKGWGLARFYTVSRMLLVLIQCLVRLRLTDAGMLIPLSLMRDGEAEEAGLIFTQLHQKANLWRRYPSQQVR